jgi:hypothetical protein
MKIFINTIAFGVFVMQFIAFVFNVLNMHKPDNTQEVLYNDFVFAAYLCSLLAILIFVLQYNLSRWKHNSFLADSLLFIIALLGIYVGLSQIFVLSDFILVSCIMLLFDAYIIKNITISILHKL